jgi:microcystin-dependent protein
MKKLFSSTAVLIVLCTLTMGLLRCNGPEAGKPRKMLALNYIIALQGVFPSRNVAAGEDSSQLSINTSAPFIGSLVPWPINFAPRGWAFCHGQILSIAQNTALFSLLGTTYGGDGVTTFALPDLRDRGIIGAGGTFRLGEKLD